MGQTADQLRQEIEHKRDDAAAKIGQIEARVQDIPNLARATVKGSVDQSIGQVRESVDQSLSQARVAVEAKVEKLKEQTDIQGQVGQRPLAALGVAFAGGYLLGKVLGGDTSSQGSSSYQTDWSQAHSSDQASHGGGQESGRMGIGAGQRSGSQGPSQPNAVVVALKQAAREAGLDNTLSALSGALVATLTDQFNRTIRETFPDFARHLEQQGGLGAAGTAGGSSTAGGRSGMGGSAAGGSGMGGSSMSGAGSAGSGSGMGSSASSIGGTGSAAGGGTTSTYGQSGANTDAASRTFGAGDGGSSPASTDASGRPTSYFGSGSSTAQ